MIKDLIFEIAAFMIAAVAFGFGAVRLFKKGKPLYLQILVCAAGCIAVGQLSFLVNLWCNIQENTAVGLLGIFGSNLFLLSANYGALDKIVDDGAATGKTRAIAALASVVTGALAAATFFVWRPYDPLFSVFIVLALLPAVPAAYFNAKHLFLPPDPQGFLHITRPCNLIALLFYFFSALTAGLAVLGDLRLDGILSSLMSVSMLALVICAGKGAKQWGI